MNLKRFLLGSINIKAISTQLMMSSSVPTPCVVVFGRPGSGKTTVAEAAVEMMAGDEDLMCLGLDLDVCVPQWMRDNFSKGIYPTLKQREVFALECCDYVEKQLEEKRQLEGPAKLLSVVSFSFVNKDLRDIFRSRFPHAKWVLIDTSETEATRRINMREGHFYKGESVTETESDSDTSSKKSDDPDNSEWKFAPVMFDHVVLDGGQTVESNAKRVVEVVREAMSSLEKNRKLTESPDHRPKTSSSASR